MISIPEYIWLWLVISLLMLAGALGVLLAPRPRLEDFLRTSHWYTNAIDHGRRPEDSMGLMVNVTRIIAAIIAGLSAFGILVASAVIVYQLSTH